MSPPCHAPLGVAGGISVDGVVIDGVVAVIGGGGGVAAVFDGDDDGGVIGGVKIDDASVVGMEAFCISYNKRYPLALAWTSSINIALPTLPDCSI